MLMPGGDVQMMAYLIQSIAMEGSRFALCVDGRALGAGVVVRIIE